jgi:acetyl-CoA carboxylase carboxyltransferase component
METLPNYHTSAPNETIKQPLYATDDLLGIIGASTKTLFEIREVMARIIDGSDFMEFKPNRGEAVLTGFANIHGYAIGIVANNGVLGSEAVEKVTEFVHVCQQQNRPLLFLQHITEGMVAQKYSEKESIHYHVKMIKAIKRSETPVITLILAENYDTEHYTMYGRNCEPRFIFAYPNNRNYTTSDVENDGVIDPRETRNYVGFALAMVSG